MFTHKCTHGSSKQSPTAHSIALSFLERTIKDKILSLISVKSQFPQSFSLAFCQFSRLSNDLSDRSKTSGWDLGSLGKLGMLYWRIWHLQWILCTVFICLSTGLALIQSACLNILWNPSKVVLVWILFQFWQQEVTDEALLHCTPQRLIKEHSQHLKMFFHWRLVDYCSCLATEFICEFQRKCCSCCQKNNFLCTREFSPGKSVEKHSCKNLQDT